MKADGVAARGLNGILLQVPYDGVHYRVRNKEAFRNDVRCVPIPRSRMVRRRPTLVSVIIRFLNLTCLLIVYLKTLEGRGIISP